jgi:hypothetical protein
MSNQRAARARCVQNYVGFFTSRHTNPPCKPCNLRATSDALQDQHKLDAASIQAGFSAKAIGFGGTSKPNARRFPMEFKTFSNGNQIVFQWKLKRFPMEIKTFSNGN